MKQLDPCLLLERFTYEHKPLCPELLEASLDPTLPHATLWSYRNQMALHNTVKTRSSSIPVLSQIATGQLAANLLIVTGYKEADIA